MLSPKKGGMWLGLESTLALVHSLPQDTEVNQEKLKETTLFGGGFLERTMKRIEEQKALAKVAGAGNGPPS